MDLSLRFCQCTSREDWRWTSSDEAPRGDSAPRTLRDNVHGTRNPQSELSHLGLGVAGTEPRQGTVCNRGTSREVSRSLVHGWVPHEEIEHQGPWRGNVRGSDPAARAQSLGFRCSSERTPYASPRSCGTQV